MLMTDRDEQREREMEFSALLRQKAREGRPSLENLRDRDEQADEEADSE